jgi:hypothetical protein
VLLCVIHLTGCYHPFLSQQSTHDGHGYPLLSLRVFFLGRFRTVQGGIKDMRRVSDLNVGVTIQNLGYCMAVLVDVFAPYWPFGYMSQGLAYTTSPSTRR